MRTLFTLPLLLATGLSAQVPINGPMPGHADLLEATIWMQCKAPCSARLEYWVPDRPDSVLRTPVQDSEASRAHAMDFVMDQVVPGTTYSYRPVVNGRIVDVGQPLTFSTQPLWKFRADPPRFTVALGSCAYINEPAYDRPGTPYGSDYGIFNSIAAQKPDLMLWLGDNIYLREPDWGSRTGFRHRYTHLRSTPELQALLRSTRHYAIWDDHDFGPNDADASFVNGALAREMFDLFWPNPGCGVPGAEESVATSFSHADVDFFLMDDRSYRVPPDVATSETAMLGAAQIEWLIQALKYSDASFKLIAVGSQVLSQSSTHENYATFTRERSELLRRIDAEGIANVVFLTGDRHFTELSALPLADGRRMLDLTCSSLTSGTYKATADNPLRVEGTVVEEKHNFALLTFDGKKNQRAMTIRVLDAEGKLLWERVIAQEQRK
ncbi:MAG: alkaline phosphatase family protein [Flavobacteriales bacterium]|nr:alkaline phosphatase family protein [Flavobacteriales bacterium]